MSKPRLPDKRGSSSGRTSASGPSQPIGIVAADQEPLPLGPPPSLDGLERLEVSGLFDEVTNAEERFVLALGSAEFDPRTLGREDESGASGRPEGGPSEPVSRGAGASPKAQERAAAASPYTDWPEPPSLPEPPERFAPPELTLPPRLPQASSGTEEPLGPVSGFPSGLRIPGELGTPELPELTPSDLPNALLRRLNIAGGARGQAGAPSDSSHSGLGVVSQVMDVPLGVMRPGSSEASYNPTNPGRRAGAPDGSVEIEFPTAVWSADFPQEPQGRPAAMLGDARGGGAGEAHKRKDGLVAPLAEARQELIAARYLVLDRIGQGGMARIFRVRHVELGKDFALKIIHSALSEDAKVKEMFYQEARLASSLDHPNIVLVTDFGVDERLGAFIVMEYLKGETLHSRLRREGKLHQNVACEITLQVAEALQFIHGRDVVHCDIKSENVFLCEPPAEQRRRTIVKLLDFGLSRQKIASGRVSMSEVGGTPAYMAPERINRQSPRPSMDIYSLGILLYEMLTGTLPFNGTVEETLLAQLHQAPEPMSARTGEPPDDRLEALVMRAMAKKPEERQKNMAAVLYELRTVMDMLGIGRRRGRAKAQARGLASERPRDAELLVAECPLPLFMTDLAGNLVLANKAFTAFVNIREDQVAGMPLADTRLGRLCPEVLEDLRSTVAAQTQRQRMLSFPWRSHGQVSMMIWLAPKIVDKQPTGVIGVVHPFGATPTK